jgi:hypothetical protein
VSFDTHTLSVDPDLYFLRAFATKRPAASVSSVSTDRMGSNTATSSVLALKAQ